MPIRVVGFDGDDTLWHSETRFSVTQAEFRELLKRHVPDADVDARLSEMEMKNLSIYGYGVKSFTLSMLETAIELTQGRIPASDLEVVLGWGQRMLMEPTKRIAGLAETRRAVSARSAPAGRRPMAGERPPRVISKQRRSSGVPASCPPRSKTSKPRAPPALRATSP